MKRLLFFSVLSLSFVGLNSQACQEECRAVCGNGSIMNKITANLDTFGKKIENVQLPVVGKLGNILPIAVVAFCLQKFPRQAMVLVAFGLTYGLYCNEKVRELLDGYTIKGLRSKKTVSDVSREDIFDDNFFVFSGESALDAEEEEDDEDDLLDEYFDMKSSAAIKKPLSFL